MKNIIMLFVITLLGINMYSQTNSEEIDKKVIKNVVLINSSPWEVLMSKNGDILAKVAFLPDYLKGYDIDWEKDTNFEPDVPIKIAQPYANDEHIKGDDDFDVVNGSNEIEVYFSVGSALLNDKSIEKLNKIAKELTLDKRKVLRLFGFINEPESRYSILGKRRMDAVIAYLKIKGVDIDTQIKKSNNVKGVNNKIVLALD